MTLNNLEVECGCDAAPMKKVAVFGNAGGGKSTLARHLAARTRLPLFPLDRIQYRTGSGKVPHEDYLNTTMVQALLFDLGGVLIDIDFKRALRK